MPVAINYYFLLDEVTEFVRKLFSTHHNPQLIYHNLAHTNHVVEKCIQIGEYYKLDQRSMFILKVAAWFHDCGHLFGSAGDHEIKSAQIMSDKLIFLKVDQILIHEIKKCILATKLPASPASLNEKIICDADLYHLGTNEFAVINDQVKQEYNLRKGHVPVDWNWRTLKFLTDHCYFTTYCQAMLSAGKQSNIAYIKEKIARDN